MKQHPYMLLPSQKPYTAWHCALAFLLSAVVALLVPEMAHAGPLGDFLGFFTGSTFYCSEDLLNFPPAIPIGKFYDNGIASCDTLGITHIFSGFVCQFEKLVSDVFGSFYCGMQYYLEGPLMAFTTLFVVFIGVGFLTSYLQFTAKEVVMILFKVALVWTLATQSHIMISYVFNGFMGFMQGTVYIVLQSLMANVDPTNAANPFNTNTLSSGNGGLFKAMDGIIEDIVSNSVSASMVTGQVPDPNDPTKMIDVQIPSFLGGNCINDPLKIIIAIGISMPPLMFILLMTFVKLVMVLLKTLLGYLLCITGVMFLLTLAPIFLSLGLFRITQGFFASWLRLLVGFAVQVFIMFAFLAVAIGLFAQSQFADYQDLVMPWGQEYSHDALRFGVPAPPDPAEPGGFFCTLCDIDPATLDISFEKGSGPKCKDPKTPVPPTALYSSQSIVEMLGIKLFMLALIAYLFESILNLAPQVATQLSSGIGMMSSPGGGNYAPSISTGGVSAVPGKGHLQAGRQALKQASEGGFNIADAIRGMLGIR